MASYLNGWLRLLRLPNLLTVPGDVLAGVAVMVCIHSRVPSVVQLISACIASLLLYAAGLLCNDLVDQERDAHERPERPLPSGVVRQSHVVVGLVVCCVGAIVLGLCLLPMEAVCVEISLLVAILTYNHLKQKYPITGGAIMGLCRGLNVLFGAAILMGGLLQPSTIGAIVLAGCWTVYILAVTLLAQRETTGLVGRGLAFLPAVILLAFVGIFYIVFRPTQVETVVAMTIPLVLATMLAAWSACRIARERTPEVVQKSIGLLIRNLILLQAAACFSWDSRLAVALLALWPINYLLCRWFYAS